eukprot:12420957-Karenia_brevis.AAC.3
MHVWRETSFQVYRIWSDIHIQSAQKYAKTVPPKCLAGRWGSTNQCSAFVHLAGRHFIEQVFGRLLHRGSHSAAGDGEELVLHDGDLDCLRLEEQHAHRVRMGKWRRDVLSVSSTCPESVKLFQNRTSIELSSNSLRMLNPSC